MSVQNVSIHPLVSEIVHWISEYFDLLHGGTIEKGKGSLKYLGFILWGIWMCVQTLMAIHPKAVKVFQPHPHSSKEKKYIFGMCRSLKACSMSAPSVTAILRYEPDMSDRHPLKRSQHRSHLTLLSKRRQWMMSTRKKTSVISTLIYWSACFYGSCNSHCIHQAK